MFMVEMPRVEKSVILASSLLKVKGLFNQELFNPMVKKSWVEKFMVKKSEIELSGVEAWG